VTVPVIDFVHHMELRWTELGNVPSHALRMVWGQLAKTFNESIEAFGGEYGRLWRVVRPETGTGKTQGLCLYASMLPLEQHPGVLVVVRLKEQAKELASTINELAGARVASDHHTDNRLKASDARSMPVLVITHEALKRGMVAIDTGEDTYNWDTFMAWGSSIRKLVVIDEEFDLLQEAKITLRDVLAAKTRVLSLFPTQFPDQVMILDKFEHELRRAEEARSDRKSEHLLWDDWQHVRACEMEPLCAALYWAFTHGSWPGLSKEEVDRTRDVLLDIEHIAKCWCWQSRQAAATGAAELNFNSAKLISSRMPCGAVVLDATADQDVSYQVLGDQIQVLPRPANARQYRNVTVNTIAGYSTGKNARKKTMSEDVAALINHLNKHLTADRKVLVVTHKDIVPTIKTHETAFTMDAANWKALDGKNQWQDYDTIVIFTLPHRPPEWSVNLFWSAKGPQSTKWLQSKEHRIFGDHDDIRQSLEMGKIACEVIQAVNRIRCRRVINAEGDCAETEVFLYLPARGCQDLKDKLRKAMPGIRIERCAMSRKTTTARPSQYTDGLLALAKNMKSGTQLTGSEVRDAMGGVAEQPWGRLCNRLKKGDSGLRQSLNALGVSFVPKLVGKQTRYLLVKP
jgi:hypothetical protein